MTVRRAPQLQRRGLHILLKGDKPKANQWLPWAKKKLHTLERYHVGFDGKSFGTKIYPVERGFNQNVTVFIKVAKDQKWIIIEAERGPGLYMESGILNHREIAHGNELTWLPSILFYNDAIEAIREPGAELGKLRVQEIAEHKLDGENRGEGDSHAVGCPNKSDKVREIIARSFIGGEEKVFTFTSEVPKFCEPPAIHIQKNTQVRMPPSMFSGKLRLMVQAMYGSKRTDYTLNALLGNVAPLELEHGHLSYAFVDGMGLFSGRNFEYFVIRVGRNGIWAREFVPSEAGKTLRRYLRDNPGIPTDRKLRYETYLLSTLYFAEDSKWYKIGGIDDQQTFGHGNPWSYGWAWKMDGSQAKAVTIHIKDGSLNTWEATTHRLDVNELDGSDKLSEGRLKAAAYIDEGPSDFTFRVNEDLVWFPDFISGGMQPFVPAPGSGPGSVITHIDSDVPVYAMLNYDTDTFDFVRFRRQTTSSGVGSLGGSHTTQTQRTAPGCSDSACGFFSDSSSDALEVGFYIEGNTEFEAIGKEASGVTISANEGFIGAQTGVLPPRNTNPNVHLCEAVPDPNQTNEARRLLHDCFGAELTVSSTTLLFEGMLIVPFFDCDSIYLGRWQSGTSGGIKIQTTTDEANVIGSFDVFDNPIVGEEELIVAGAQTSVDWGTALQNNDHGIWSRASAEGWLTDTDKNNLNWDDINIQYYANDTFVQVRLHQRVNDSDLAANLYVPSCAASALGVTKNLDTETFGWTNQALDHGGFSNHWDPILFPEPVNAPPIISRRSVVDNSFVATEKPGQFEFIDDGTYNYDKAAEDPDGNQLNFSYVGFA